MLLPLLMNLGMLGNRAPGGGNSGRKRRLKKITVRETETKFFLPPQPDYPSIPIEAKKREIASPPDDEDIDDEILVVLLSRLIH